MTEKEKRTILDMRAAGRQYKEISAELGIEVSALKVFVHRQKHNNVRRCEQCKKVFITNSGMSPLFLFQFLIAQARDSMSKRKGI